MREPGIGKTIHIKDSFGDFDIRRSARGWYIVGSSSSEASPISWASAKHVWVKGKSPRTGKR